MTAPQIFVVNHTDELLELFHEILSDEGYRVSINTYGSENLQRIQQMQPDLIILDYSVRHEDRGWHLLQTLKQGDGTAHIPVIVSTTNDHMRQEIAGYLATGDVHLLPQPFDIDDFLEIVKRALRSGKAYLCKL